MTDNELLLAISEIMDKKIEPLKEDINDIKSTLDHEIKPRLDQVEERLEKVENDVHDVKLTLENNIKPRLEKVENDVHDVKLTLESDITPRLKKVEYSIHNVEISLENGIKPRLQNIEGCYLTTYERYQSGVTQIDSMQSDIDIMKKVVIEHGEKLKMRA